MIGRPPIATGIALIAALVASAACGASAPTGSGAPLSARPPVPVSAASSSAAPIGSTGATSASPTSASPSGTAAAPCAPAQLRISIVDNSGAAGTVGAWLRFLNTSGETCSLHGWPTLIGVTASGASTKAREMPDSYVPFPHSIGVPTVALSPGEDAFAAYLGSDNPVGGASACPPPYHTLRVAPPGTTTFVALTGPYARQPACIGILVSQIVPASAVPELLPLWP